MEINLVSIAKLTRLVLLCLWATVILTAVALYLSHPTEFTAANIAAFIHSFESEILVVYLANFGAPRIYPFAKHASCSCRHAALSR
jgi:hypothetical protein